MKNAKLCSLNRFELITHGQKFEQLHEKLNVLAFTSNYVDKTLSANALAIEWDSLDEKSRKKCDFSSEMRSFFLVFLSLLALSFLDYANAVQYDAKTIDYLLDKVDFTSFPKINGEFYLNIYKGLIPPPTANKLRINEARIIIAQHQ